MPSNPRRIQFFLFFLLLGVVALPGCTQPTADEPPAPAPALDLAAPEPEHRNYTWHLRYGIGAGSGGGEGGRRESIRIPAGIETIDVYANWTCPFAQACEAKIIVDIDTPDDHRPWYTVSGPSPLHLQIQNPMAGNWEVGVGRSFNPSFTYEAKGTLEVVVCCAETSVFRD